jgi:hypothetical protein
MEGGREGAMANKQVRDVIRAVRKFHHCLADLYQSVCDRTEKERLRMLLHYMSRHEQNLAECLLKYEREGSKRALDYWFRMKADEDILDHISQVKCDPRMSANEVIDAALLVDSKLVSFYKHLAEKAETEEVRDLFSALFEMEKKYEGALVRDALELEDE